MLLNENTQFGIKLFEQPYSQYNTLLSFIDNYSTLIGKRFDVNEGHNVGYRLAILLIDSESTLKEITDHHKEDCSTISCPSCTTDVTYDNVKISDLIQTTESKVEEGRKIAGSNKTYYIKDEVKKLASKISLNNFSLDYLSTLKNQKSTYLLDNNTFFRFYKQDNILMGGLFTKDNQLSKRELANKLREIDELSIRMEQDLDIPASLINSQKAQIEYGFDYNLFFIDLNKREIEINDRKYFSIKDEQLLKDSQYPLLTKFVRLLLYICLSEITVEFLPPNSKTSGTKKEGKIVNNSKSDVIVVGSKWNTISIRTEGFDVNGHFRLQPCGKNRQDVKMIWIDAFKKHGYIKKSNKHQNSIR